MSVVTLVQPRLRITTDVHTQGRITAVTPRTPLLVTVVDTGLAGPGIVTVMQPRMRMVTEVQTPGRITALATREPMLLTFVHAGLRGAKGDPGGGGDHLQFDQPSPAATWTINHNFGTRPNVSAYSAGGRELWAEILHVSVNQTQILFDSPVAGYAILS